MVIPLYLVHGLKNNTMFLECVCAHSPDYTILMYNTGYAVLKQGITPTFSCILTLNQDTNNWLNCMEFSSGLVKARKIGVIYFPCRHLIDKVQIVAQYSVVELTAAENKSFK